jgi:hypothetical protein
MGDTYKEPPLDKASSRVLVSAIVGNENAKIEKGNWHVTKSRVISGNMNRLMVYAAHLEGLGIDVSADVINIQAATIGFSKEIPDYGERGEAIQILTQQDTLPKFEKVREGGTGVLKRPEQPTEQP